MKKILIIPSWYPSKFKPYLGLYFLEQAQFLNEKKSIDISILFGCKSSFPLVKWGLVFINAFIFRKLKLSKCEIFNHPPKYEFSIPANRRIPDFLQLWLERLLYRIAFKNYQLKRSLPDLIHAQSGMDAAIYANDIAQLAGLPLVILEHQVFVFHYYTKLRARLVLDAFKDASRVGAVSYAEKRQILMNQPDCNPLIIPNLIDENIFQVVNMKYNSCLKIVTIMYADHIKGYEVFFKAMQCLKKEKVEFKFTVVGKPWKNGINVFEKICNEFDLMNNAIFIDRLQRDAIPKFYQDFNVYVCTSDFESFGIAPREAMMCGLPVVTTANGGVEEIINDNTGFIVPLRDHKAIADAILKIKNNEQNYDPFTIRENTKRNCGADAFITNMWQLYEV
ncbi:glycosyltransferase family 4 protein [Echinicola salinicaeni]|uniref:glycosyltransferase family 4 protein n=1 Tax=Echinicola salinicaeni TaxID=2762757 RepID=UPI0016466856|nr:glycosyltransferase family 4 protein [Echinicola salinicaeni]